MGWISGPVTDHDSDGCRDAGEDLDDDNDTKPDIGDDCRIGELGWISDSVGPPITDYDNDGCRDATEDL